MMFLIVLTLIFFVLSSSEEKSNYPEIIKTLQQKISDLQIKKSTNFSYFPPSFNKQKGLYESYIHFNFVGNEVETEMRRKFKVIDNNMFTTNFILTIQLEVLQLGLIEINQEEFHDAVTAILSYVDNSEPLPNVPIYRFWPQFLVDGHYESYAENLVELAKLFPEFDKFAKFICTFLRIEKCENALKEMESLIQNGLQAFHIPPDLDDSSCNLNLGSLMYSLKEYIPDSYFDWKNTNIRYDILFEKMIDFAYKPFNTSSHDVSIIDPRTYNVLHEFLKEKKEDPEFMLPSTWLMSIQQTKERYPYEGMPLNVNNVDANVVSNFILGMTRFFMTNTNATQEFLTPQIKKLYLDGVDYLVWGVDNQRFFNRSDIAMLYYPSLYDLTWFVTRTAFELNNMEGEFPFPELKTVAETLLKLGQGSIYQEISKKKVVEDSYVYWDDILGDYGGKQLGEDRLFSTSLAVLSLINAFSESDSSCYLKWRKETMEEVKTMVHGGIQYLEDHILKAEDSFLMNAFFSGSGKNFFTMPFFFPANTFEYLNGTIIPFQGVPPQDLSIITDDFIDGMNGFVEEETYDEKYMKEKWFGVIPTTKNQGYESFFPFWSSPCLTYSFSMLAFAKYYRIENCQ